MASSENDTDRTPGRRGGRDRKLVFVVPSLLTTGNIFCGFYSITESLLASQALALHDVLSATEHFDRAAISIGFAYLFDALDGRIARMTGATTEFGVELDSIADVLSFGVAPALLAFAWGYGSIAQFHKIGWAVSFLFVICGALRLARFNVLARQPGHIPPNPKADKKAFVGMPIPAGAALLAAVVHFTPLPLSASTGAGLSVAGQMIFAYPQTLAVGLIALVVALSFLMVSTLRYSSFKGIGVRGYHPRVLILGLTLLVLAIVFWSRWTLLMLAGVYVLHGLVSKAWSLRPRRRAGHEASALEIEERRHST